MRRRTYFFTIAIAKRSTVLLVGRIHDLRGAFRVAQAARPFAIDAIVILPENEVTSGTPYKRARLSPGSFITRVQRSIN